MANQGEATVQQKEGTKIKVTIFADKKTKKITVDPEKFLVSKSKKEVVQWLCTREHEHKDDLCFTVHFGKANGTPFETDTFKNHQVLSGTVHEKVEPSDTKLYEYTVTVPGVGVLDPKGGVTP
jgi:hypothetical protein